MVFFICSVDLQNMEEEWFADAKKNAVEGKINKAGCCAVSALLVDNVVYVGNAGDSRCVMIQVPLPPIVTFCAYFPFRLN
jgi:serine/threonine protein phosphatase PrpC